MTRVSLHSEQGKQSLSGQEVVTRTYQLQAERLAELSGRLITRAGGMRRS